MVSHYPSCMLGTLLPDFDPVYGAGGEAGQRILDILYTATQIGPSDKLAVTNIYIYDLLL